MASPQQRVGEYVLQDRIAAGTFGEVWRAHHHVWHDRVVAVKIPTDPQYLRNLQREGVAIHGLTHPNIVRALGFDPYADPPYLTMEFVPGTSLRPLVQKPEYTMLGRTYSLGYEPDLVDVLMHRPRRTVLNADWKWAVWYPLRRSGKFAQLPVDEQRVILAEHGSIGEAGAHHTVV